MIPATMTRAAAGRRLWDAIVIGAGPAGSVAALGIARRGLRVLLVERAQFPRYKLCGTCLNADAQAVLADLQLRERLEQLGGVRLDQFVLRARGQQVSLTLPAGIAIRRSRLDAMLVESAVESGADFLPGSSWQLDPLQPGAEFRTLSTHGRDPEGRCGRVWSWRRPACPQPVWVMTPRWPLTRSPGHALGPAPSRRTFPRITDPA